MKLRLSLYLLLVFCLIITACISEPGDDDDTSNTDSSSTELSSEVSSSSENEVSSDNQMSSDNKSSDEETSSSSDKVSSSNPSSATNTSSRDEESSSSDSDPKSSSIDESPSSSSKDQTSSAKESSSSNKDSSSSKKESSSSEITSSSSSEKSSSSEANSSSSEEPSSSSETPQITSKVTGLNLAIDRQVIQQISEGETIEIQRTDNETINFYAIVEGNNITSVKFEATGWADARDEDKTPNPWAAHGQGVSFPDGETAITLKITPVEDLGEGTSLTISFTIKIPEEEPSSSSEEPSSSSEMSSSSDESSSSVPTTTPAEEKNVSFKTSDNVTIRATLGIPELDGNSKPAVIFIHAGGRNRSNWTNTDVYDDLWDQGFYVLAIDLRDHGSSDKPGTSDFYNNPNGAPRDVQAAIDYLEDIDDVDDSKIAIIGESVGGNLACVFSQDKYNVKTAVSMSSKTSAVVNLGDISGTPKLKNVFHISSVGDGGGDRKDWAEELYGYTSGERKVVSNYSGSGHGVSIFNSNPGAEQDIIDWILDTID